MDNALILFETDPAFNEKLGHILNGYNIIFSDCKDGSSVDAKTAENTTIIFGNPKVEFLKLCPRLKWLQLHSAGAAEYTTGVLNETVLLSCSSGCYGHAVSEHMVGLSFALFKKLHLYRDEQLKGRWQDRGEVKSIQGAVVLVVGVGDLGSNYAKRMKALGSYVIGVDLRTFAKPDYLDEFYQLDQLEEHLARCDLLALTVPGIKDNAGLIGRAQLAKMKKDAVLINAGRGNAIDTDALYDALQSGALGAAGLEVTEPEPLPSGHRLWKLENALITPHVAGGRHLPNTVQYILELWLENSRRFVQGEALKSQVDYKTGFKKPNT